MANQAGIRDVENALRHELLRGFYSTPPEDSVDYLRWLGLAKEPGAMESGAPAEAMRPAAQPPVVDMQPPSPAGTPFYSGGQGPAPTPSWLDRYPAAAQSLAPADDPIKVLHDWGLTLPGDTAMQDTFGKSPQTDQDRGSEGYRKLLARLGGNANGQAGPAQPNAAQNARDLSGYKKQNLGGEIPAPILPNTTKDKIWDFVRESLDPVVGIGEGTASLATGALSNLAGMVSGFKYPLDQFVSQGKINQEGLADARKWQNGMTEAYTYQPRSRFGNTITSVAGAPIAAAHELIDRSFDDEKNRDTAKYILDAVLWMLPSIKGVKAKISESLPRAGRWSEVPGDAAEATVRAPWDEASANMPSPADGVNPAAYRASDIASSPQAAQALREQLAALERAAEKRIQTDLPDTSSDGVKISKYGNVRVINSSAPTNVARGADIVSSYPALTSKDLFNPTSTSFEAGLRIGKDYYINDLMGDTITSPAFGGEQVRFTPSGWLYTTREYFAKLLDKTKTRSQANVMGRVKMLPKVKEILRRTEYVDEIRELPNGKVRYGLLGRFEDGSVVRVVVEEVKQGGKKFLSVFDWKEVGKKLDRTSPSSSARP